MLHRLHVRRDHARLALCVHASGGFCSAGKWKGVLTEEGCLACKSREGPSVGFGDTVAKAAKAVGIRPCGGCQRRREALNRLLPYGTAKNADE